MSALTPQNRRANSADTRHSLSVYDGRELLGHVREEGGRCCASTWPDGRDPLGEWIRLDEAGAIALGEAARRARGRVD